VHLYVALVLSGSIEVLLEGFVGHSLRHEARVEESVTYDIL
jgi:cytochrome b subunit of formate dehydrogenase